MPLKSNVLEGEAIDSDYRENVKVILPNFSNKRVEFNTGDRIAQILFGIKEPPKRKCIELSSFDDFVTERNNKGFGSTGV